jgi:hypothetical protein
VGETALKIAGLQKVVGIGLDDVVMRFLAMRPVLQKISDIGSTALARRPDEHRRHRHLVEGLVPDLVQPVGHAHAGPDAGIDEIEEKKPDEAFWSLAGQRLHCRATDIMTHHPDPLDANGVEESDHVGCMAVGPERTLGFIAVAETAEIRRDERIAIGKAMDQRFPGEPEFRPTMQQEQRRTAAGTRDMKGGAVRLDGQMLDGNPRLLTPCGLEFRTDTTSIIWLTITIPRRPPS